MTNYKSISLLVSSIVVAGSLMFATPSYADHLPPQKPPEYNQSQQIGDYTQGRDSNTGKVLRTRVYDTNPKDEWPYDVAQATIVCEVGTPNEKEYKVEVLDLKKKYVFRYNTNGDFKGRRTLDEIAQLGDMFKRTPNCPGKKGNLVNWGVKNV